MSAAGADAGAGTPGAPGVPAPPNEANAVGAAGTAAPLPESLPALPEDAEVGDGRREEADFLQYSQTLGVDLTQHGDLLWAVQEAFNAPLPMSWTEHTDDEGRVYFFNESSNQSTWEHPMDQVYRELLSIVQRSREADVLSSEEAVAAVVQAHIKEVHQRAIRGLEDWSGPYASEEGEYYYNNRLKVSTWDCPLTEWEQELMTRHSLLCRCLLAPGRIVAADGTVCDLTAGSDGSASTAPDLLAALRLPLNLVRPATESEGERAPDTPSTSRSFHTARSMHSSRSQRSRMTAEDPGERSSARGPSPPANQESAESEEERSNARPRAAS
eukprot:TRINITY_DN40346_c0_g1_i1.p1 TRINITY_DN40346_c0_g1~~TRINITY_DN40346_c0_g1_i1.p1  ORF type:complete len:349 (-),score=60.41 TRINITY_DN40346_c0_g1_i1:48-1031(-)